MNSALSSRLILFALFLAAGPARAVEDCAEWDPSWSGCSADDDCRVVPDPCGWPLSAANKESAAAARACNAETGAERSCATWDEIKGGERLAYCKAGRCMNRAAVDARAGSLNARIRDGCAPWDGPARRIVIERLDVTVDIYNEDIKALEDGNPVRIKVIPGSKGSAARRTDRSTATGWRSVGLEIRVDLRSRAGHVVFQGRRYELKVVRDGPVAPECG